MSKYETNESAADHYEGPRCTCARRTPEDGPCPVCERREDLEACDDFAEAMQARKLIRQEEGRERRRAAWLENTTASMLAAKHGLTLLMRSEQHYQLFGPGRCWLINVYPGNQRLHRSGTGRSPFLNVERPWTLAQVVQAAIEATKGGA